MCNLQQNSALRCLLLVVFACYLSLFNSSPVWAQLGVNLDFGGSITTAHVPDIVPPSTPILISPEDGDLVVVNKPSFLWYGSTDNVAVDHYQLWINSGLYFSNIPISDLETAFFDLTYDNGTNTYTLTTKQSLIDGNYTWSIVAVDAANNESTSATWSFTVDTLVPNLSITLIEGKTVLITTTDTGTIPTSPIVTSTNAPLISGTGEANTTLLIVLSIPGEDTTIATYNIGAGGTWSYQFPTLEDNVLATLSLIIEDDAGHNNVLSPIEFIHNPSPTATPAPSGVVVVTATPTLTGMPTATPTPTPRATTYPPTFFLSALTPTPFPTRPPSEQSPIEPFIRLFSTPKTEFVISRGHDNVTAVSTEKRPFFEYLSFIFLVLPLITTALMVLTRFRRLPDIQILRYLWWFFGFDKNRKPDGEIHDRVTLEGFYLIPITLVNESTGKSFVAAVSDRHGFFALPKLEDTCYRFFPDWNNLSFPSHAKRPESLPWHKYYQGEKVALKSDIPWPFLHIPVERKQKQSKLEARLLDASLWRGSIFYAQAFILVLLYLLSPSAFTAVPLLIFVVLGFLRLYSRLFLYSSNNISRY